MGQGGEAANHSPPAVSDDIHYQALRGVDNRTHQIINTDGNNNNNTTNTDHEARSVAGESS